MRLQAKRALTNDLHRHYRKGVFEVSTDFFGIRHIYRTREADIHNLHGRCVCDAKVTNAVDDDGFSALVAIHRKMRNSRALYQPWEQGH